MKTVTVKLSALSICPCGSSVLNDDIQIGTEYEVCMDRIEPGFTYRCGHCGRVQEDVVVIYAKHRDGDGGGPLPVALFDLPGVSA